MPYDSVRELVDHFQTLNTIRDGALPEDTYRPPNFVMVRPELYFGTYGGLIRDSVLEHYRLQIHETHSLQDSIGHDLSIVWWNTTIPPFLGDLYSLVAEGRVAVTPKMFEALHINTIRQNKPPQSSYYKAWRMNDASNSNSDSE